MAYVGYDYSLGSGSGSGSANPNPFVYPSSGTGQGYGAYDAPFNPQLDHLGGETRLFRAQEWRVTTTSTTSLTAPWAVGSRTLPGMNWPSQTIGLSQSLNAVHHPSIMLPLPTNGGLLHHQPLQPHLQ
ncbi:hypothetical protein PFISCL1PPCAC_17936, partial [Pristionchus fissidentatus]